MIQEKKDEKDISLKRLQTGVDKIDEANQFVNSLQEELTKLAPVITEKIKEADELVPVVTEEQKKAEVIKEKVASEEVVVRKQADEVKAIADDAQKDLDIAMPALESALDTMSGALKSLDALDKKDIQEIKSFAKPPPLVMMTMEAVNVLLQEKPDWDTAKKVLNRPTFLQDLKSYDKDNIPEKVLKQLSKYVTKPEYTVEAVGNQSKAAKSLCMWTYAMDTYSKVAKEVEPKKQKVAELNDKLAKANSELQAKQDNLREVESQVAALQKTKLSDTVNEKDRLVAEAQLTKDRLARADILTVGLKDEGVRWRETVSSIRQDIINLTGDVFLSAASISYYGPFTGVYRNEIVDAWLKELKNLQIPSGETFDLRAVMGNPVEIREWNLQGLPADAVSINNGVMVMRGKRWPLMIDPQSQGNKWIKKKEGKELKTLKMTNPKMLLILEGCIRTGAPMLMEDVEETLDPALEPVLLKAVYEDNNRLQIKLGDSEVDYDKNFLFYMTTKMPNPHYFPEVCIKVTVINFTVTFEGLEEQLLNEVVSKEIPETLQRRVELMLQLADDKKVLKQLEDKILKLLSESSGNILDDQVLISTLGESKETSTAVNQRVKAAEEAAVEIDAACKQYTEVATGGSILYFVIADLANINPMYQFSLFYFVRLFKNCMDKAARSDDIDIRMTNLSNQILFGIFQNVCRGLFEDNKLTCSFLIATALQRHSGEISPTEWSLLLRGVGLLDMSGKPPNPDHDFFTDKMWDFVYAIQQYSQDRCPDLCQHMTENLDEWKAWVAQDLPHLQPLPQSYEEENQLHYFHYLLLLKGLAQEKLLVAIQEHTRRSLGEDFIIFPTATVAELYADSTRSTPIVFVLSTGADPTSMRGRVQMGQSASELGAEPPAPAPAPSEPTPEPSTWRSAESEESEAAQAQSLLLGDELLCRCISAWSTLWEAVQAGAVCRQWRRMFVDQKWADLCVLNGGVCKTTRPRLWRQLTAVGELEARWCAKLGVFDAQEAFNALLRQPLAKAKVSEIERDVHRTYPTHERFSQGAPGRTELSQVLQAAVLAEPMVGYCQGMNFVAATLLLHVGSPCEAFWLLLALMEGYHFRYVFAPSVPLLPLRCFQFAGLVRKLLPRLWRHLREDGHSLEIFAHQCVLTLFSYTLEPDLLAHVYDVFFLLGWKAFFQMIGVSLLAFLEDKLLGMCLEDISRFLHQCKRHLSLGPNSRAIRTLLHFEVPVGWLEDLEADFQLERLKLLLDRVPEPDDPSDASPQGEPLPAGLERNSSGFLVDGNSLRSANLPPRGSVLHSRGRDGLTPPVGDSGTALRVPDDELRKLKEELRKFDEQTQLDVQEFRQRIAEAEKELSQLLRSTAEFREEVKLAEDRWEERQAYKKTLMEAAQVALDSVPPAEPMDCAPQELLLDCREKLHRLQNDTLLEDRRRQTLAKEFQGLQEDIAELKEVKARSMVQLQCFLELRTQQRQGRLKNALQQLLPMSPLDLNSASTMGVISLGQGQGPKAKAMVVEARKKGTWVLLQNCHLYKTFMPELEKMCEELEEPSMTHKDFRLFLTSMPAAYFPVPVLQNGIKLTTEPPKGLRANIVRSFLPMSDDQLNDSAKAKEWRRLQFGLKFFHAVIQERRKFGPLGWNIRYEFNDSDLETSTTITHNMLELDGPIPWDTLLFVIGHINYGGRVTDDNDRRLLLSILERYVTPKILEKDYIFSESGTYRCPDNSDTADIESWRKFVASFPLSEQPEVFGMHDNANISFMSQESEKVLNTVLSIQPREAGGTGGKSSEEVVLELSAEQEGRLPEKLSAENAHAESFAMSEETGLMTSLGTCLSQEMTRFNRLLAQMTSTLKQLQKAVKGIIVMTGELDDMFNAELNNLVPAIWTKDNIGYPCLKPLNSWFEDMILRFDFFRDWIEGGIPVAYWISSFYFPQGFLTSVLQGYSRGKLIPVDQLSFEFVMQDTSDAQDLQTKPEEGIYIHGLFMDGAAWNYEDMAIDDQEFGTMFVKAPIINFIPWQVRRDARVRYRCPIYKTSIRAGTLSTTGHSTNFVLAIEARKLGTQTYDSVVLVSFARLVWAMKYMGSTGFDRSYAIHLPGNSIYFAKRTPMILLA
ncbi:unnamed protein product [Effrenium voratum]|uniref:Rab-GAP TBC domain-containing protein n=1 Tax=Effrenium voratum TaxID=2562239 RepID=A0AA36HT83_9DINO|nr:unnamed protein product [Effrenium voratum]